MFSQAKNVIQFAEKETCLIHNELFVIAVFYIKNFEPDRWPAGSPYIKSSHGWQYGDIDLSPTFSFMLNNIDNADIKGLLDFAIEKRPLEEL